MIHKGEVAVCRKFLTQRLSCARTLGSGLQRSLPANAQGKPPVPPAPGLGVEFTVGSGNDQETAAGDDVEKKSQWTGEKEPSKACEGCAQLLEIEVVMWPEVVRATCVESHFPRFSSKPRRRS
jgi:hypothetical protein